MTATLSFLGAAGTVTGSKFLLESGERRVLVDSGLFQGEREWRRRNWDPPSVRPESLHAVVITHAHLDHCGYLPVLVRHGFAGDVVCSPESAELIAIVLRDAAYLQEEEARWARESGLSRHQDPRPLFDTSDAEKAIALLAPTPLHEPRRLTDGFSVTLRRAGHILGSCFAEVRVGESVVTFSGDLGRPDHPLLLPPEDPGPSDYFVVESTYGDRPHTGEATAELGAALSRTLARGGVALLPAFAVDRTALLLREIEQLVASGQVPDVPVFVDSPMALRALEVYRHALDTPSGRLHFRPEILAAADPFDPGHLQLAAQQAQSEQLNDPRRPCIVISASGMATGGRVLHHLEHQLPQRRNAVIITGYQVLGTRGRMLADGAGSVKIHGRYVPVRAEVVNIRGYSAHADCDDMLGWLGRAPEPRSVFVVHSEPSSAAALADRIQDRLEWTAVVPRFQEKVRVDERRDKVPDG
ncbi:Beta-lactamase domain protein [metagenome]|uniref:Beta-lactamase domain protein n=1 Tax=metagenome TaxID=256318 RepID=A0A2P2C5J5_9ZZZZ